MYEDFIIIDSLGNELADIEVINDEITREINGQYVLTFEAPQQELKTEYLTESNSIKADNQTFDIMYGQKKHNIDGKISYSIEAWHVFYRLKQHTFNSYVFDGTPTQILNDILSGTGFSVGTVDFTSVITFSVNEPSNALELIHLLATYLGGEVEYSGNGFEVNILNTIGQDNGFEIRYSKNLKGIEKVFDKRQGTTVITYSVDILELKNSTEYVEKGYSDLEVIGIGDTVYIIDEVADITATNRIKKVTYSPRFRKNTSVEIANKLELFTDKVTQIQREAVHKNQIYNGIKISADNGFEAIRSDDKAKTIMNATEGISVYSDVGSGLEKNFFVDTDGRIKAKNIDIEGSGSFGGDIVAANVTMHNGTGTGSLNFNLGENQYIVLKTAYTTGGNTLILGKSGVVGGTPGKMERVDIMAGTMYVYDNLYVAENVTCLKINDVDATDYLHSENLTISDNLDFTSLVFYGKGIMSVQDLTVPNVFLQHNWIFEGNVTGAIWCGTQAEAMAKTDWLENQIICITDEVLPELNADLPESLSTVTASDLNNTNIQLNKIKWILIHAGLAREVS